MTAMAAVLSPLVFALGVPQLFPVAPGKKPLTTEASVMPVRRTAASTLVSPGGAALWVDPQNASARAARTTRARAGTAALDQSALLAKAGRQPHSTWLGEWLTPAKVTPYVAARVTAARAKGAVPVFVLYAVPYRDCGSYSAGGHSDAVAYRAWVDAVAAGLAGGRAVAVLEPDAVASVGCLPVAGQTERLALLKYAATRLARTGTTSVYLDGGNARWQPAAVMAARLRSAGIEVARGFVVNAGNFDSTQAEVAYGKQIGAALGAPVPFVVDTSRNGLGPYQGELAWCNPPGRALGAPPTTRTGDPLVDAFLWVKTPGLSDGTCRGGPTAGTWWQSYAVGLARRADW